MQCFYVMRNYHFPEIGTLTLSVMALFHCMVRHGTVRYGSLLGGFPLGTVPGTWYFFMALFHCMVRYGSARLGTVRLSSGRFAFPPQFSTAIEWAGLFTRRYNCAASTAVTSS